jgi:hypothetical protein
MRYKMPVMVLRILGGELKARKVFWLAIEKLAGSKAA